MAIDIRIVRLLAVAATCACLVSAHVAGAQGVPKDIEGATSEVVKQFTLPAETLLSITKPAEEIAESIARISKLLQGNEEAIRNAEKEIDRMLDTVERAGAASKPDGEFVKRIQALMSLAHEEAQAARDRGTPGDLELQKEYEKYAEYFKTAKDKAVEYHAGHFRILRLLRDEKARLVQGLKLAQFKLARKNVEAGLKLVEKAYNDLDGVRKSLPKGIGVSQ